MKYEVILEHNSFKKRLATFLTKKLANEYMEINYKVIGNDFENPIEFSKFYCAKTREVTYESDDLKTKLIVRKLTK